MQNKVDINPHITLDAPKCETLAHISNLVQGFKAPKIPWINIIDNERTEIIYIELLNFFLKIKYNPINPIIPVKDEAILWIIWIHPKLDWGRSEFVVHNGQEEHTVPAPFHTAYEPVSTLIIVVNAKTPIIIEYLSNIKISLYFLFTGT